MYIAESIWKSSKFDSGIRLPWMKPTTGYTMPFFIVGHVRVLKAKNGGLTSGISENHMQFLVWNPTPKSRLQRQFLNILHFSLSLDGDPKKDGHILQLEWRIMTGIYFARIPWCLFEDTMKHN